MSDGTRTRDILDHNQVLYQLSYTHHGLEAGEHSSGAAIFDRIELRTQRPRQPASPAPSAPNRSAIAFAAAESGPGGGTNTAAR